ncbi:hypothetical protein M2324_002769 [Rhodovulum sulfidophilum]|nr:hypothetical protein [Rhodovulum sulfidophilum]
MPYLSFRCMAVCRFRSVRGSVTEGASGAVRAWPGVCLCCGPGRDWRARCLGGSECAASAWQGGQSSGPRKTASVPAGRALYVRASRSAFRAGSAAPAFRIAARHPAAVGRARQQSGGAVEMRRNGFEIHSCVNALRGSSKLLRIPGGRAMNGAGRQGSRTGADRLAPTGAGVGPAAAMRPRRGADRGLCPRASKPDREGIGEARLAGR